MNNEQQKTPMTMEQAVQYTGYSRGYLYRLIAEKAIPYYKPDTSKQGKVFFCKEELTCWIFRNRFSTTKELHEQADAILTKKSR